MKVKLMAYTQNPELTIAKAMRGCRHKDPAYKIELDKPIEYYIRLSKQSGHYSVLEHASFTFSVEGISRTCSHQLVRHRIASYSQQSTRVVKPKEIVIPKSVQDDMNWNLYVQDFLKKVWIAYDDMVESGIPREDARYFLPMGSTTNIVITMNGRELLHFFKLRLHPPAQWEIQELAKRMLKEVKNVAPTIFEDVK